MDAVPADLSEWWGVRGEAFLNGCGLGGAEFLRAGTQFPHAEFFQLIDEGLVNREPSWCGEWRYSIGKGRVGQGLNCCEDLVAAEPGVVRSFIMEGSY